MSDPYDVGIKVCKGACTPSGSSSTAASADTINGRMASNLLANQGKLGASPVELELETTPISVAKTASFRLKTTIRQKKTTSWMISAFASLRVQRKMKKVRPVDETHRNARKITTSRLIEPLNARIRYDSTWQPMA